jgi:RNA polymerase sigma factor (sigma-70 family)
VQKQTNHTAQDLETSDNVLVHQALTGNQGAFEILMSRYEQSLFVLICRYLGEYHETHDVLQLVWLQLYLSLATLHPNVHIRPWLFTVARNRSLDILRRKHFLPFSELEGGNEEHEAVFLDAIVDTSPTPEEVAELRDLQREIQHAIRELPHNYRSVVLLYYGKQLTFSEIGHLLNISGSAVKTRFNRAKPLLRAALTAQLRISSVQV